MTEIDSHEHKVTVTGNIEAQTLLQKLSKSGKPAELWVDKSVYKGKLVDESINQNQETKPTNKNNKKNSPKDQKSDNQTKTTEIPNGNEKISNPDSPNDKNLKTQVGKSGGNCVNGDGKGSGNSNDKKKKKKSKGSNNGSSGNGDCAAPQQASSPLSEAVAAGGSMPVETNSVRPAQAPEPAGDGVKCAPTPAGEEATPSKSGEYIFIRCRKVKIDVTYFGVSTVSLNFWLNCFLNMVSKLKLMFRP